MRTVRRDLALGEYVAPPAAGEDWLIAIYLTTAAPSSAAIAEVGVENRSSLAAALLSAEISRHTITVRRLTSACLMIGAERLRNEQISLL